MRVFTVTGICIAPVGFKMHVKADSAEEAMEFVRTLEKAKTPRSRAALRGSLERDVDAASAEDFEPHVAEETYNGFHREIAKSERALR